LSVGRYGAGDFIGGLSLLGSTQRLFALKASEDTACLVLTREKFAKAIEQFPELIPKILKSVVDRIRSWDQDRLFEMTEKGLSLEGATGISAL
jgi:CRP-like cAMP-binding protein